ncbi:tRNA-modifying protein YgfZ [hydrothermal vent metagenome]|uniref:tRNA-modifying protein YgfZ n=1 Tax=hydrothermal vent metagenome TaxID=652676 RepID=A0A3B0SHJ2_9ZZZZ
MKLFTPPSKRSVLQITGKDAPNFLQGMISNDMDLLEQQPAIYAALLTPQGKIISNFFVIKNETGGFWLDCPTGAFATLRKRLSMFRLRADVAFADVSQQLQVGLSASNVGGICFSDPRIEGCGFRALCKPTAISAKKTDRDLTLILPEQDIDFTSGEVFPSDINMDLQNGIAWKKGCYVGQEVVSRMKRRGKIRKRTALVVFDAGTAPIGVEIFAGKTKIGHISSAFEQQALALVRTDRLADATAANIPCHVNDMPVIITLPKEINK